MRHFIFGYGSLICPLSRAVTAPSLGDAIAEPAVISHIERTWSARVSKRQCDDSFHDSDDGIDDDDPDREIRGWTPMGVRFRRGAECNGVLIRVDDAELARFDAREVGYARRRIDLADVRPHSDHVDSAAPPPSLAGVRCAECRLVFEIARAKRSKRRGGTTTTASGGVGDGSHPRRGASPPRVWNDVAVWVYVQKQR
jgi:hypothetical protein